MYTGKSGSLLTILLSLISRMKYSSSWVRPTAKEGNHHVAALGDGLVDDSRQIVGVAPDLGVVAVAVSGLHDHVIRPGEEGRVPDDGLVHIADVAGEDEPLGDAALGGVHDDGGGAQQMAGIHNSTRTPSHSSRWLVILAGGHVLAHPLGVLDGVQGLHMGGAGALGLVGFFHSASDSWIWAESWSMMPMRSAVSRVVRRCGPGSPA